MKNKKITDEVEEAVLGMINPSDTQSAWGDTVWADTTTTVGNTPLAFPGPSGITTAYPGSLNSVPSAWTQSPIDFGDLVPCKLEFTNKKGRVIGTLDFGTGQLKFSGSTNASADKFFKFLKPKIDAYMKTQAFKMVLDEHCLNK